MTYAHNTALKIKNKAIRELSLQLVQEIEKLDTFDENVDKKYRDLLKNSTVLLCKAADYFIWGYITGEYDYYKYMKECVNDVEEKLGEMRELEDSMSWFNDSLVKKISDELGKEEDEGEGENALDRMFKT